VTIPSPDCPNLKFHRDPQHAQFDAVANPVAQKQSGFSERHAVDPGMVHVQHELPDAPQPPASLSLQIQSRPLQPQPRLGQSLPQAWNTNPEGQTRHPWGRGVQVDHNGSSTMQLNAVQNHREEPINQGRNGGTRSASVAMLAHELCPL
jgi:hypothetical protein